jgi:hypothetical protein
VYDALRTEYRLSCPVRGETGVTLSAFRQLERLPGAAHPAVYRIIFDCSCGGQHEGLVSHDDLDWAPLGLGSGSFVDLMTSRVAAASEELGDHAASRIQSGQWPWSFFCYPEGRPRAAFPSSFFLLAPGSREAYGLAVRCPSCQSVSINLVSQLHVDLPFHNDAEIGVVEHVFRADAERAVAEFRAELASSRFDARRLEL